MRIWMMTWRCDVEFVWQEERRTGGSGRHPVRQVGSRRPQPGSAGTVPTVSPGDGGLLLKSELLAANTILLVFAVGVHNMVCIRQATMEDMLQMQRCNLLCLPENYQLKVG